MGQCNFNINSDGSERVEYDYYDYPSYIHLGYLSAYPNHSFIPHWHEDIEFIYVQCGSMLYNMNGQIIHILENQGIFVNSKQIHYGYSDSSEECEFICFMFHPGLISTHSHLEHKYVWPLQESSPYIHLTPEIEWQKQILSYLKILYQHKEQETYEMQLQGYYSLIWCLLYKNMPISEVDVSGRAKKLTALRSMMQFIHAQYTEKITLAEIAAVGNTCKTTCNRIFSEFLNQTPINYLINYRLNASINLMKNSNLSLTEIALRSGFSSSSFYSETFQRVYQMSPSEYRSKT